MVDNKCLVPPLSKRNDLWVDIAKGIAIFLVVVGHSYPPGGYVTRFIFLFHMPLFFIIAGYLFNFKKYSDDFKLLLTSSFQRLILPAIIAFFFFYDFNSNNFINRFKTLIYAIGKPIPEISLQPISFSLWFIFCLFVLRIVLWTFLKITTKYKIPVVVNIVLAFMLSMFGAFIGKYVKLPWSLDIAFVVMYVAYIGYLLKQYSILDKKRIYWLVIPFIVIVLLVWNCVKYKYFGLSLNERFYSIPLYSLNLALIISFVVFSLCKLLEKINIVPLNICLQYLGVNSLTIMIVHMLVRYPENVWSCISLRVLLSIIFIEILALIPKINEIFGVKSIFSFIKRKEK